MNLLKMFCSLLEFPYPFASLLCMSVHSKSSFATLFYFLISNCQVRCSLLSDDFDIKLVFWGIRKGNIMRDLRALVSLFVLVFQAVKSFVIACINCFPIEPLGTRKKVSLIWRSKVNGSFTVVLLFYSPLPVKLSRLLFSVLSRYFKYIFKCSFKPTLLLAFILHMVQVISSSMW